MNLWTKYKVIPSLVLLVSVGLVAGCSPATSPEVSKNSSSNVLQSKTVPTEDWSETVAGQSYAEALNGNAPSGQIQLPSNSQDAPPDSEEIPAVSDQPESPEMAADSLENPSLKAAPPTESQTETETEPQTEQEAPSGTEPAADESAAAAAAQAAPAGEANIGFQAPDFTLQTVDGQSLSLADLRGKNILLNYWVTWCIPCLEEMPVLEKLYQEYQEQDLVILSVNGIKQDEIDKVMTTMGENSVTFPVVLDQASWVYDTYKVQFMPTSFFIDDQGVIRYIQLGSATEEGLRSKIEQLISDQL